MAITLSDLFSKNPRELTKEEKLKIVRELRDARSKWVTEQDTARSQGRRPKTSAGISKKKIKGVEIDEDFFKDLEL
jgi:hypothetical protein